MAINMNQDQNAGSMDQQNMDQGIGTQTKTQNMQGERATNSASPGVDSHRTAGNQQVQQNQQEGIHLEGDEQQDVSIRSQELKRDNKNRTGAGETSTSENIASDEDLSEDRLESQV